MPIRSKEEPIASHSRYAGAIRDRGQRVLLAPGAQGQGEGPRSLNWPALLDRGGRAPRRSEIRELLAVTARRSVIGFGGGLTAPELFPAMELAETLRQVLSEDPVAALQYGPTEGSPALREVVAARLSERGMRCAPSEVIITTGAQQALDLVAEALVPTGATVIVEAPTYVGALQVFSGHEARFKSFAMDAEGLDVDALEGWLSRSPRPALIYSVPTFQNPSGVTLSLARRARLLELSQRFGVPVVEDDPYSELAYDSDTPVALRAMPGGEGVIHVGTFSKVLSPGIRVGYVLAPAPVLDRLVLLKQGRDLHTDALAQSMVAEYCCGFGLDRHIERLRPAYRARRDAMLAALRDLMPAGVSWTQPAGGMFLWVTLPERIAVKELLPAAVDAGVSFVPGTAFHADAAGAHSLRLNFTSSSLQEIAAGVGLLARLVEESLSSS
jgi:2-aminoadipate transaminase